MVGFRQHIGRRGEDLAVDFLRRKGYRIVARNVRQSFGEIDIIARHGQFLVFVEVKTRRSDRYGSPLEAVDRRKQRQMIRAAQAYLAREVSTETAARFDVISVLLGRERPSIQHIVNAFDLF